MTSLLGACTPAKPDASTPVPAPDPPPIGPSCSAASTCTYATVDELEQVETSCCESLWLPSDSYRMGFSPDEVGDGVLNEQDRDHPVFVSGFFLDRFEVTRSRFYQFALEYSGPPAAGSGRHPRLEGSGWSEDAPGDWDRLLPSDSEELLRRATCGGEDPAAIWPLLAASSAPLDLALSASADVAPSEIPDADHPVTCVDWFTAFAFCAWDGGRLPTEAEWELAAAGGALDRPYPWGDDADVVDQIDSGIRAVGSRPFAATPEGHQDLAGNVLEWVLDWFDEDFYADLGGITCQDCANLGPTNTRSQRGAPDSTCCISFDTQFRSASRHFGPPLNRSRDAFVYGVRCARDAVVAAP